MGFAEVASTKELGPGKMKGTSAGDKQIVVANVDGKYYAFGKICTHMGCMLSDGILKGENVTCPCHGSIFNVKNGSVVKGPAKKPVASYEVKVEGEKVFVKV